MVAGCAATRPAAPRPAPAILPSAAELHAALAARREAVHSLRALARVRYRGPDESSTSREAIIVARPGRLRVEVLSMFGSLYVLTADDGMMTAYARRENTVYQGHATPENLWRYARLGLPVNELVDIVLGTPPLRQQQRPEVSFDEHAQSVRLRQDNGTGTQLVWFSEAGLPVAAEEQGPDGEPEWRATFNDYQSHGAVPVATHIGLELPVCERSLDIALEDVDLNPTLDLSVFALQTPPGSQVVDLDRLTD
jgi:hypothetical protein